MIEEKRAGDRPARLKITRGQMHCPATFRARLPPSRVMYTPYPHAKCEYKFPLNGPNG